jgi:N-acetylated-alpha-linked acidic dipeptidase
MSSQQQQVPDENTPLITVVHVHHPRPRRLYRHSCIRRFCSCCLGTLLIFLLISALTILVFVPDCERGKNNWRNGGKDGLPCIPKHPFFKPGHGGIHTTSGDNVGTTNSSVPFEKLLDILQSTPNETSVKEWSQYYTSGPHLAGKNLSQAEWTRDRWVEFGVPNTEIVAYDVYINYPVDHRLALLQKKKKEWNVTFEASLKEDVLPEDSTSGLADRIPTFHGYSASGNVTASYVFVNYGTYRDFEDLVAANVTLKGKIALARYGKIFRGLKVKRAQDLGMVGAVIYGDPGDDGPITEANGYKTYPDGPARHPSSVQRGSVQYLSILPGDPTTPGYPSKPGCPREPANYSTPSIPSLPISYLDAIPLLKALKGHGPKAKDLGGDWNSGGLGYKGVEYWVGPTPDDVAINLYNEQEYVITPLWNVIGVINGTIEDEVIVLGNHRDAWIAGGAGDPNSGSAALNEVVRSFGAALAEGWKPLRTIVFASWDGEEYGLVGSTEWVEEYLPWLNQSTVAYLNVDVGTRGTELRTAASPILNKALIESTKLVLSPNQTVKGQTLYDLWDKHISTMGSGSDFTAFQDFAGIPSVDMGFGEAADSPIYQYHSNYDSFYWMDKFGDPGWHYHVAISKLWSVFAAKLSEEPVVPLNATDYAEALAKYLDNVKDKLGSNESRIPEEIRTEAMKPWGPLDGLSLAITRLRNSTITLDTAAAELAQDIAEHPIPWWKWWDRLKQQTQLNKLNTKYKYFERQFLLDAGLDGRPFFKHVVFAPGKWTGYAGATFPGLVEAIEEGNSTNLWKWGKICMALVEKARDFIEE